MRVTHRTLLAALLAAPLSTLFRRHTMPWTLSNATAVLVVPTVEPSLAFWRDRLGFTLVAEVPHGNALGFAMLVKDGVDVMLQSVASVREDMQAVVGVTSETPGTSTALYMKVDDLDAVIAALGDYPIRLPRRQTFYGADEVGVLEPGGHLVVFAKPPTE
ncbi:MAG: hypothetical protein MUE41_03645 [Gemmatimonadaceae bacterium]|jgi:uncharacterized glyoxalase superfamily protein PhnB|nr:hypothetical protein [Gemmatimonadaceae bacterium]